MELELVLKSNLNMDRFKEIAKYGGKVDGTDYSLLKVNNGLYQHFYELAQNTSSLAEVEPTKKEILKQLIQYVERTYPGYTVLTFEDYSNMEAVVMHKPGSHSPGECGYCSVTVRVHCLNPKLKSLSRLRKGVIHSLPTLRKIGTMISAGRYNISIHWKFITINAYYYDTIHQTPTRRQT